VQQKGGTAKSDLPKGLTSLHAMREHRPNIRYPQLPDRL
jgi:hypothetical protein